MSIAPDKATGTAGKKENTVPPSSKTTRSSSPLSQGKRVSPPLNKGGPGGITNAPKRPAAQPARPTTTRPAATQPAVPAFEPLLDAVVGEQAVYISLDQSELRYEVTRVTAGFVTTRVTIRQNGRPIGQSASREDLRDFDPLARQARAHNVQRSITRAKLTLAGRSWDALLYEDRWTDEDIRYVRRTWVSKDAPVFGLLRMELQGDNQLEARLELISFGQH